MILRIYFPTKLIWKKFTGHKIYYETNKTLNTGNTSGMLLCPNEKTN